MESRVKMRIVKNYWKCTKIKSYFPMLDIFHFPNYFSLTSITDYSFENVKFIGIYYNFKSYFPILLIYIFVNSKRHFENSLNKLILFRQVLKH